MQDCHPQRSTTDTTARPGAWNDNHQGNGDAGPSIRVALILSTSLDCESLSALLALRQGIEVVESCSDLDFGLARCRQLNPRIVIVDPKVDSQAVELAIATHRSGHLQHVIVLDDRVHEGLIATLLSQSSVSYMTRHAGMDSLYGAVLRIANFEERVFDPAISHRVKRTPRGLRLEQHLDRPSVAALTAREREVMQLLARGKISSRMCPAVEFGHKYDRQPQGKVDEEAADPQGSRTDACRHSGWAHHCLIARSAVFAIGQSASLQVRRRFLSAETDFSPGNPPCKEIRYPRMVSWRNAARLAAMKSSGS